MLDIFIDDEDETWGNEDVFLQEDAENVIGGTCELRGCFKENGNNKVTCT